MWRRDPQEKLQKERFFGMYKGAGAYIQNMKEKEMGEQPNHVTDRGQKSL